MTLGFDTTPLLSEVGNRITRLQLYIPEELTPSNRSAVNSVNSFLLSILCILSFFIIPKSERERYS
jgi:hypothetical protein